MPTDPTPWHEAARLEIAAQHGHDPEHCAWLVYDATPGIESGRLQMVSDLVRNEADCVRSSDGGNVFAFDPRPVDHESIMRTATGDDDRQADLVNGLLIFGAIDYGYGVTAQLPDGLIVRFFGAGGVVNAHLFGLIVNTGAGVNDWDFAPTVWEDDPARPGRKRPAQAYLDAYGATRPPTPTSLATEVGTGGSGLGDALITELVAKYTISAAEAERRVRDMLARMYGGRDDGLGGYVFDLELV